MEYRPIKKEIGIAGAEPPVAGAAAALPAPPAAAPPVAAPYNWLPDIGILP